MEKIKEHWKTIVTGIVVAVILGGLLTGQIDIVEVLDRLGTIAGDEQ